jgi:hypothetical protein
MVSGSLDEHAALVAQLQARPDGLSWPQITAELLEVGSAVEVWERHVPATLMDHTDCAMPVVGYERCFGCDSHRSRAGRADATAFLTYAIAGQESGHLMRGYKAFRPVATSRVLSREAGIGR